MKKQILTTLLLLLFVLSGCTQQNDIPRYSTQKASDDFTDLFALTDSRGDALAAVTVTKIETVSDIVEKYEVYDTTYTRITATLEREFTDRIDEDTLTILLLGTAKGFPRREQMIEGRTYLLRLESWVHQDGQIWLISPLESTYLRIFDGEILVHETADDLNYKRALTPDQFAENYAAYQAKNPPDETALSKHYDDIRARLAEYDYQNEGLALQLTDAQIKARKDLANTLK